MLNWRKNWNPSRVSVKAIRKKILGCAIALRLSSAVTRICSKRQIEIRLRLYRKLKTITIAGRIIISSKSTITTAVSNSTTRRVLITSSWWVEPQPLVNSQIKMCTRHCLPTMAKSKETHLLYQPILNSKQSFSTIFSPETVLTLTRTWISLTPCSQIIQSPWRKSRGIIQCYTVPPLSSIKYNLLASMGCFQER